MRNQWKQLQAKLKKDYGNASDNDSYKDYSNRKRLMKFNRFFAQYKVFTLVYSLCTIFVMALLAFVIHRLSAMSLNGLFTTGQIAYEAVPWKQTLESSYPIFLILLAVAMALYFKFAYDMRVSFGNINVGQKGTARWTTREELEEQYKKVPQRDTPFTGIGGVPIARDGEQIYIDDTTTNNLILGGTRSGKGQTVVEPMAEIYSRAEEKASMVLTDPKLELASQMLPELERRGYRCYLLNLVDPEFSMGYNPLKLIIDEYKRGNEDTAQRLCASLAYNVFPNNPEEKDPYWTNQARNVFIAAVWAEVEDNLEKDRKENQRRRHTHEMQEAEREQQYFKELYKDDYEDFCIYREMERLLKMEPELTDEGLLFELQFKAAAKKSSLPADELTTERIRQLRSFRCQPHHFRRKPFCPGTENEEKISIYSLIKLCNALSSMKLAGGKTALDAYFEERPEEDFARITYGSIISAAETTKGTIMSTFQIGVTVFTYDSIAKMTAESTLDFTEIGFGEQPVAIFIGLPDYDASNHFLATVFINQLYFVLARLATAMPGGALYRRVAFILDEFGNLPPLDNIGNIVTVCLGRNILFSFFVQDIAQLEKLYKEDAKTIVNNCGNQIYIMTGDLESCKEISEKLGNETITVVNRTGKKLSPTKELTEMSEEKPLLTADELMRLEMGETVIFRFMFRETRTGQRVRIKATPIANMGEHRMKYAYEYLSDLFPKEQQLYRSPNMERIYEANEGLRNIPLAIADVKLQQTGHIDLRARSRSANQYMREQIWRQAPFPAEEGLPPEDLMRMQEVFDLMELTKEERELYMMAGQTRIDQETGEQTVLFPEYVISNGQIVDYAQLLLTIKNPEVVERGYRLLDLILPLSARHKTTAELEEEQRWERELMDHLTEEPVNFETA